MRAFITALLLALVALGLIIGIAYIDLFISTTPTIVQYVVSPILVILGIAVFVAMIGIIIGWVHRHKYENCPPRKWPAELLRCLFRLRLHK